MQVLVQGEPLPRLRSRKALWLLALLVLRGGRSVEREWLAETLWPDVDPVRAASNLRVVLSELRHVLSSAGERLRSPGRHTLSFDLTGAAVDLQTFDAAVVSQDASALRQAVALYRGPLLEGCAEEWVPQERAVREHACLHALEMLAETALAAEACESAADDYRRVIGMDPWRESAQRGLMRALAKGGDANAALSVYQAFVRLLRKDDPRAIPDELTTALYARLRADAKQRASVPSVAAAETVAPMVTGYLPHPLTGLVGREDEREEVAARLRRSRLVTLTGPGGIGKTRLALEVAAEAVPEFADGVWLVALDALSDENQIVPQIAAVLGLQEETGRTPLEGLTGHLHTKRLLLVLDNCEHLLFTVTSVTAHLLRTCAGLHILTTSREPLGLTGEAAWSVPALSVPDLGHLPNGSASLVRVLNGYDAVRLFAERAQGVRNTFTLTGENARSVAQVCVRLEGVPLAIELAAARVRSLTVEQIAARLDDHLSLLTSGSRGSPGRHQTLRATLDWSYSLLGADERLLLGRLSVFAGGWSLEAAERVGTGDRIPEEQILDLLTSLVDKSLVVFTQRQGEASGRYGLLETVRQYASETLAASGVADRIKASHKDWFLTLAEEAEPHLRGTEQGIWRKRLHAENDNLRAALEWSVACASEGESGLRLAGALTSFWSMRGEYSEGRKYLQLALARQDEHTVTTARGKALNGEGRLAFTQGDFTAAKALHQESLGVYQELGDKKGSAEQLTTLGGLAQSQGDYPTARSLHEESLRVFRELGERRGIAEALGHLGNNTRQQGNYAVARDLLAESLSIYRELGDLVSVTRTLTNLGNVVRLQGDYDSAETLYEESLSIRRELGDKLGISASLSGLGALAFLRADYAASQALHEESLSIRRELGNKQFIAWAVNNLGLVLQSQGDFATAKALHQEGLTLFNELTDKMGSAWSLNHLGLVAQNQGDTTLAQRRQAESLSLFAAVGDTEGVAAGLKELAGILAKQTKVRAAAKIWGAAEALRDSIGAPLPLNEQEMYERQVEQARADLGSNGFTAAWEEGLGLSWEQATEFALNEERGEISGDERIALLPPG